MKNIRIGEQTRLGFLRTLRITLDAIRYRLFRASITVAVIAIAVAFLMNILSESLIKISIRRKTREKINELRLVHIWATKLTRPGSPGEMIHEIAKIPERSAAEEELCNLVAIDRNHAGQLLDDFLLADRYLVFFADLDYGVRRNLVHTARGIKVFDYLLTEAGRTSFAEALSDMKSFAFVTSQEKLEAFLSRWPDLRTHVERMVGIRKEAVAKIVQVRGDESIYEMLADAEQDAGRVIRDAGFDLDRESLAPLLAQQAKDILSLMTIEATLKHAKMRKTISNRKNIVPADITVPLLWKILHSSKTAAWYLEVMRENNLDAQGLTPEAVVKLSRQYKTWQSLNRADHLTMDLAGGWMGLGPRTGWLLLVSMLVCGIGITNAMLMTVTERFREIATMKCLGALDSFIMLMFVLESCVLGFVGGCIGALIGTLIGTGRMMTAFGFEFAHAIDMVHLVAGCAASVAIGVMLAALAAVYPALKAAQLPPMEAMRIE